MKNLTQEEREQIAIEEFKKRPFETLNIPCLGHAGELMLETNADSIKMSTVVTLKDGKQYKVEANYTISSS